MAQFFPRIFISSRRASVNCSCKIFHCYQIILLVQYFSKYKSITLAFQPKIQIFPLHHWISKQKCGRRLHDMGLLRTHRWRKNRSPRIDFEYRLRIPQLSIIPVVCVRPVNHLEKNAATLFSIIFNSSAHSLLFGPSTVTSHI